MKKILFLVIIISLVIGAGFAYWQGFMNVEPPYQVSLENAGEYLAMAKVDDVERIFDAYKVKLDDDKEAEYIISFISGKGDPEVIILDQKFNRKYRVKLNRKGLPVKFNGFQFEKIISSDYYQPVFSLMSKDNNQINDLIILGYVKGKYRIIFDATITESSINELTSDSHLYFYQFPGKDGARDVRLFDKKENSELVYKWIDDNFRLVTVDPDPGKILPPHWKVVSQVRADITGGAEKDIIAEASRNSDLEAFMLKKENGLWVKYTIPMENNLAGQERLDNRFARGIIAQDINGDNKKEVLIHTSVDASYNKLFIFRWTGVAFESLLNEQYYPNAVEEPVRDTDGDGLAEITAVGKFVDYDRGETETNFSRYEIREYRWDNNSYRLTGKYYRPNPDFSPATEQG